MSKTMGITAIAMSLFLLTAGPAYAAQRGAGQPPSAPQRLFSMTMQNEMRSSLTQSAVTTPNVDLQLYGEGGDIIVAIGTVALTVVLPTVARSGRTNAMATGCPSVERGAMLVTRPAISPSAMIRWHSLGIGPGWSSPNTSPTRRRIGGFLWRMARLREPMKNGLFFPMAHATSAS